MTRFFSSILILTLTLLGSLQAKGDEPFVGLGDRGSRLIAMIEANLDANQAVDKLSVAEHPGDDGYLTLSLASATGQKISNEKLVYGLDRDEGDVASYGLNLKSQPDGSVTVSSVKDWGMSIWSHDYTLVAKEGKPVLSAYHYTYGSPYSHGDCSLDFAAGKANLNGVERKFKVLDNSLEHADGGELIRLCQKLMAQ